MLEVIFLVMELSKSFSFKFILRLEYFLLFYDLFVLLLYIVGNYKDFLDSTQVIILSVMVIVSTFLFLLAVLSLIGSLAFAFGLKKIFYLWYLLPTIISFVVGIFSFIFAESVLLLHK